MKKIKVSRELKECLDYLIELRGREWIIKKHAVKMYYRKSNWVTEEYKLLNELNLDFLAKLLYQGYEVEETKEEKLLRYYENSNVNDYRNGIHDALCIMNISIEGINK